MYPNAMLHKVGIKNSHFGKIIKLVSKGSHFYYSHTVYIHHLDSRLGQYSEMVLLIEISMTVIFKKASVLRVLLRTMAREQTVSVF